MLTTAELAATATASPRGSSPAADPGFPRRWPRRPWAPRRGSHGAGVGAAARGRAGLRLAGPRAARRRGLAPYYWPTGSRTPSSTPTCARTSRPGLAPPSPVRRPAASPRRCGRWSSGPSTSCSTLQTPRARSSGRATPTARHGRSHCSRGSSSVCHSLRAHRPGRGARPRASRLGAFGGAPGIRRRARARRVRAEAPVAMDWTTRCWRAWSGVGRDGSGSGRGGTCSSCRTAALRCGATGHWVTAAETASARWRTWRW